MIVLGLLAVAPFGSSGPGWPLWLLRFECAAVYGASGLEQAPRSRLVRRHGPLAAGRAGAGRPGALAGARLGGVDFLTDRDFYTERPS